MDDFENKLITWLRNIKKIIIEAFIQINFTIRSIKPRVVLDKLYFTFKRTLIFDNIGFRKGMRFNTFKNIVNIR